MYQYLRYINRSLTCLKKLHGAFGCSSHQKVGVLRIFIVLKNPLPWPSLNSQPLGPVASTLTTTPPRQLMSQISKFPVFGWSSN
jgi:hypothetical protein